MLLFIYILAVMWTIFSTIGWIQMWKLYKKNPVLFQQVEFYMWSISLDFLVIAFWIWTIIRFFTD